MPVLHDFMLDRFTMSSLGMLKFGVQEDYLIADREGTCLHCGLCKEVNIYKDPPELEEQDCEMWTCSQKTAKEPTDMADFPDEWTQMIGDKIDRAALQALCLKHAKVFVQDLTEPVKDLPDFVIETTPGSTLPHAGMRRLSDSEWVMIREQLQPLLEMGIIEECDSPVCSPPVLVRYDDGSSRLCIDYRVLNAATVRSAYPTANLKAILDIIGGHRFYGKIDLLKAYHQLPLMLADVASPSFVQFDISIVMLVLLSQKIKSV